MNQKLEPKGIFLLLESRAFASLGAFEDQLQRVKGRQKGAIYTRTHTRTYMHSQAHVHVLDLVLVSPIAGRVCKWTPSSSIYNRSLWLADEEASSRPEPVPWICKTAIPSWSKACWDLAVLCWLDLCGKAFLRKIFMLCLQYVELFANEEFVAVAPPRGSHLPGPVRCLSPFQIQVWLIMKSVMVSVATRQEHIMKRSQLTDMW